MEVVNAEVLFNYLGKRYEDAYANSPNLKSVIQDVLANLKPGSSVLDVGCGTGKPVAAMIASAGHSVYGIDVADEMVRISRSQVQGRFEKADLRSFNPSQNFDAIFVIFSLYQISPSETHAAAYRFARWLRDDGVLVLGTTSGSSINLNRPGLLDDKIWGCIRWLNKTWMTKTTNETFLSEEGWRSLLNSAGFTIESEKLFKFLPEDNEYKVPENHFIVVARKTIQTNPLFGPYPLRTPNKARPTRDETVWKEFQQRVEFENGHSVIVDVLKSGTKILDIGDGLRCFRKDSVDIAAEVTNTPIGSLGHLPFENQSFDVVYAMSALEYVEDLAQSLEEIARVADKTNPRAHIVIMQGAAENEALKLIDSICAPLSTKGEACHQGYLLHTAASLLPRIGFPNIRIQHVTANLQFSEITLSEQCAQAAESLASLRHLECSNFSSMKENLIPQLKLLFQDHPGSIRNEMIVLIASL